MIIEFQKYIEFKTGGHTEFDTATVRVKIETKDGKIQTEIVEIQIDDYWVVNSRLSAEEQARLINIALEKYYEYNEIPKRLRE